MKSPEENALRDDLVVVCPCGDEVHLAVSAFKPGVTRYEVPSAKRFRARLVKNHVLADPPRKEV